MPILRNRNGHCFDRKEGRGWGREKCKGEKEEKAHENRHMQHFPNSSDFDEKKHVDTTQFGEHV